MLSYCYCPQGINYSIKKINGSFIITICSWRIIGSGCSLTLLAFGSQQLCELWVLPPHVVGVACMLLPSLRWACYICNSNLDCITLWNNIKGIGTKKQVWWLTCNWFAPSIIINLSSQCHFLLEQGCPWIVTCGLKGSMVSLTESTFWRSSDVKICKCLIFFFNASVVYVRTSPWLSKVYTSTFYLTYSIFENFTCTIK